MLKSLKKLIFAVSVSLALAVCGTANTHSAQGFGQEKKDKEPVKERDKQPDKKDDRKDDKKKDDDRRGGEKKKP